MLSLQSYPSSYLHSYSCLTYLMTSFILMSLNQCTIMPYFLLKRLSTSVPHSENKTHLLHSGCVQLDPHSLFSIVDFNTCSPPKLTYWNLIPKMTVWRCLALRNQWSCEGCYTTTGGTTHQETVQPGSQMAGRTWLEFSPVLQSGVAMDCLLTYPHKREQWKPGDRTLSGTDCFYRHRVYQSGSGGYTGYQVNVRSLKHVTVSLVLSTLFNFLWE